MKTAVVTDSNSGITAEMGEKLGVFVVPMPVMIDGKTYYFQSWGGCVTGTKKIDGTTYVFDKNGVLLSEKES